MINGNRTKSNRGRSPRDLYITAPELAEAAMKRFAASEYEHTPISVGLDAGCGNGVWAKASLNCVDVIHGIDLVPDMNFGVVHTGDFLEFQEYSYELIFGNPPYSLAEEFIRHSFELLEPHGYVYFLLRLSFLEGIARGRGLFKEFPMKKVFVCSRRPSFFTTKKNGHTTDTLAYAMFLWQKGYNGQTVIEYLDWDYNK